MANGCLSARALVLSAALALAFASCGDSVDDDGVTATATSVTAAGRGYEVVEPAYDVAPLPGSDGMYGSGCVPGSKTLPDGIWFGEWASVSATSAEFDLACFGPGPDGPGDVTNTNPQLRTVTIHPDALVWRMGDDGSRWDLMTYGQWLTTPPSEFCWETRCPVWLYINGGHVTEIVELWFA